eukprot:TRINITY_DN37788_c0_g1_i1.p1 TRINITY_DN37788_c0_g1~~TRINITY_DN37788_c0_g1_i1.p1  ORF type:complete len:220 (-),score=51.90 TRINITY_DN37788_c0_g1_i1:57-716(-)
MEPTQVPPLSALAKVLLKDGAPVQGRQGESSSSNNGIVREETLSADMFQGFFRPGTWKRASGSSMQSGMGPTSLNELLDAAVELAAPSAPSVPAAPSVSSVPVAVPRRSRPAKGNLRSGRCICNQRHWRKMSCQDIIRHLKSKVKHRAMQQVLESRVQMAKKNEELLAAKRSLQDLKVTAQGDANVPVDIREFLAQNPGVNSLGQLQQALGKKSPGSTG